MPIEFPDSVYKQVPFDTQQGPADGEVEIIDNKSPVKPLVRLVYATLITDLSGASNTITIRKYDSDANLTDTDLITIAADDTVTSSLGTYMTKAMNDESVTFETSGEIQIIGFYIDKR